MARQAGNDLPQLHTIGPSKTKSNSFKGGKFADVCTLSLSHKYAAGCCNSARFRWLAHRYISGTHSLSSRLSFSLSQTDYLTWRLVKQYTCLRSLSLKISVKHPSKLYHQKCAQPHALLPSSLIQQWSNQQKFPIQALVNSLPEQEVLVSGVCHQLTRISKLPSITHTARDQKETGIAPSGPFWLKCRAQSCPDLTSGVANSARWWKGLRMPPALEPRWSLRVLQPQRERNFGMGSCSGLGGEKNPGPAQRVSTHLVAGFGAGRTTPSGRAARVLAGEVVLELPRL